MTLTARAGRAPKFQPRARCALENPAAAAPLQRPFMADAGAAATSVEDYTPTMRHEGLLLDDACLALEHWVSWI